MKKETSWILVIIISIVVIIVVKPIDLFSVHVTKNTIYDNDPDFEIEVFEEKGPFSEARIEVNFNSAGGYTECGCVPYQAISSTTNCRNYGWSDAGLSGGCLDPGCSSTQRVCHKTISTGFNPVTFNVGGTDIQTFNNPGTYTSNNFASVLNSACQSAFYYRQCCDDGGCDCEGDRMECYVDAEFSGLSTSATIDILYSWGTVVVPDCNTRADYNCDGCVSDSEFPNAVNQWLNQNGITDEEFPSVVNAWRTQVGC